MTKQELQDFVKNLRKQSEYGKNRFDPALANLFFKTQSEVDNDIAIAIEEFVKKRGRMPTPEEVAGAYVKLEEKRAKLKDQEIEEYFKENEEELEYENDLRMDNEQNNELNNQVQEKNQGEEQDLFLLDRLGNNLRLQVRKELEEKNLQNRQQALMERNLKILVALEKIRDTLKQEKGKLEISGDIFKGMNGREIKQQLGLLKAMGVKGVSKDQDSNILENDGRDINIETLTEADIDSLESGEVSFAISLEKLRDLDFKNLKEWLNQRDAVLDGKEVNVPGLDKIAEERQEPKEKIVDDDEMSL